MFLWPHDRWQDAMYLESPGASLFTCPGKSRKSARKPYVTERWRFSQASRKMAQRVAGLSQDCWSAAADTNWTQDGKRPKNWCGGCDVMERAEQQQATCGASSKVACFGWNEAKASRNAVDRGTSLGRAVTGREKSLIIGQRGKHWPPGIRNMVNLSFLGRIPEPQPGDDARSRLQQQRQQRQSRESASTASRFPSCHHN